MEWRTGGGGEVLIEPRQYRVRRLDIARFDGEGGLNKQFEVGPVEGRRRGDDANGRVVERSDRIERVGEVEGAVEQRRIRRVVVLGEVELRVVGSFQEGGEVVFVREDPAGEVPLLGGWRLGRRREEEVVVLVVVGVPGKVSEVGNAAGCGGGRAGAEVGIKNRSGLVEEVSGEVGIGVWGGVERLRRDRVLESRLGLRRVSEDFGGLHDQGERERSKKPPSFSSFTLSYS